MWQRFSWSIWSIFLVYALRHKTYFGANQANKRTKLTQTVQKPHLLHPEITQDNHLYLLVYFIKKPQKQFGITLALDLAKDRLKECWGF